MKNLIFIFLVIICSCQVSCSDNSSDDKNASGVVLNNGVRFRVLTSTGENYLETLGPARENIRFYKLVNGLEVEHEHPHGFVKETNGAIYFRMDCREQFEGDNFLTIIKWNETDQDTLTYSWHRYGYSEMAGNYRFNGTALENTADEYGIHTVIRSGS